MKRQTLALGLALALCIGLFPVQTVAAGETDPVAAAREAGLLVYFEEGFTPELDGTVTMLEAVRVAAGLAEVEVKENDGEESDLSPKDQAIVMAVENIGIMYYIRFNNEGVFKPEETVPRWRIAETLYRTLQYRAEQLAWNPSYFSNYLQDVEITKIFDDTDDSFDKYINPLYNLEIIDGMDGRFSKYSEIIWKDLLTWCTAAKLWSESERDRLVQLTAPTDLEWNVLRWKKADGTVMAREIPGYMNWYAENGHQNCFEVTLFRQGEDQSIRKSKMSFENSGSTISPYFGVREFLTLTAGHNNFCSDPMGLESGLYYYTVKAVGDGILYRNSEESQPSEVFEYIRPNERLVPPNNLQWDGVVMRYSPSSNLQEKIYGYYVEVFYSETNEAPNPDNTHSETAVVGISKEEWELPDRTIQSCGPGYYWFRVQVLSADINQYQGSDWSELSPAYHLTDIPTKDSLGDILASAEGKTPEEVRSAVQELNTGDLKNALLADRNEAGGTADLLGQLEGKTGITVTTAAEKPEFEDMASNAKIVGAALNDVPEGTDTITLNIGSPEKEHVIPEQYHNAVALRFGMGLDGVVDQENLKVPVRVTLPIPDTINPQFLVLLHYGQDGSMEELGIDRVYTFQKEGKWYASFVLTHFSDFILTELKQEEPEPTPTPTPTPTPPSGGGSSGGGGGGSSAPTYSIAAATVSNGKVELSPKKAEKGAKVTVTLTPDKGYVVAELTVLDSKGKAVALTEAGEGKYTFIMPASKVEVKALFREEPPAAPVETPAPAVPVSQRFTDIMADSWYTGAVQYVCDKGLMEGMSRDTFVPEGPLTRGALVTILYRLEGEPGTSSPSFRDVPAGQWYAAGVSWASGQGIVNGYGDDSFRPEAPVTREQLVTILYRYAVWKKGSTEIQPGQSGFPDEAQTSAYARQAVRWALASGLINGYSNGTFRPEGQATRAEIAALLMRFCEEILK